MNKAVELRQRITDYLAGGGLFNPEMAIHDRVRDLLIDCREALRDLPVEAEPVAQCPHPSPTVSELIRKDIQFEHLLPDAIRNLKAAIPRDAKEWLCRQVDFGEHDGHGHDAWRCAIAKCIEDLEVALASQIDITNIERAQVHALLQKINQPPKSDRLMAAGEELLACKKLKEEAEFLSAFGPTQQSIATIAEYNRRKPLAWAALEAAIKEMKS